MVVLLTGDWDIKEILRCPVLDEIKTHVILKIIKHKKNRLKEEGLLILCVHMMKKALLLFLQGREVIIMDVCIAVTVRENMKKDDS